METVKLFDSELKTMDIVWDKEPVLHPRETKQLSAMATLKHRFW